MRIATWNVNSIAARLPFVLHWLEARSPDVVMIQELKVTDEAFPHEAIQEAGYRAATYGQAQYNGVAILSRQPLTDVQTGLDGQADMGARVISATAAGIRFTSVYVPNGKTVTHADYKRKLDWLDAFVAQMTKERQDRHVLGGDFNLVPQAVDSHAPEQLAGHIFHTESERERFERLIQLGLVDLYRHKNPDGTMFSWWDYRAGAFHKNHGLRIDFLLATPSVSEQVDDVMIDRDYRKKKDGHTASDHAPVIANLAV